MTPTEGADRKKNSSAELWTALPHFGNGFPDVKLNCVPCEVET